MASFYALESRRLVYHLQTLFLHTQGDCRVARITTTSIAFCAVLFASLAFTPLSQASEQTRTTSAQKKNLAKADERKKKSTTKKQTPTSTSKKSTASSKTSSGKTTKKDSRTTTRTATKQTKKVTSRRVKSTVADVTALERPHNCTLLKGRKNSCPRTKAPTLSAAHKARVQKAQSKAMSKLMNQIGKPYRWGGTSPNTGFDCSGLVYYAYKDLVKFRIPRTANEMYHLRDAAPVGRNELQNGDLVFFRTQGRGAADHVGVYVGNGKFIQSPRSGQDIQITSLSEDYWQQRYVGARRVMTPTTLR